MTLITGQFSIHGEVSKTPTYPTFPSTIIAAQYHDASVRLEAIQQASNTAKSSAIFYSQALQIVVLTDSHLLNRAELLRQLSRPFSFSSQSDAELILCAYQTWGEACASYLTGNFAFAIWDIRAQKVILGRDISGQRSLFYYVDSSQTVYFASLPRYLYERAGFQKNVNAEKIANFLTLLPGDNQTTFFKEIYAVPAAHIITFQQKNPSPTLKRYWSASDFIEQPTIFNSKEDYYEAFQTMFSDVISDYISSQTVHVSQLSGGLDSSAVACMAAKLLQQQNKKLITMCHVPRISKMTSPYPNWNYDDTYYMEAVEKYYPNVINHYVHSDTSQLFDYCEALYPWLDCPSANPSNNLWFLESIKRARKLGATTLLTGQRGNSTISWAGPSNRKSASSLKNMAYFLFKQQQRWMEWTTQHGLLKSRPWRRHSGISDALAHEANLFHRYHQRNNQKKQIARADFRDYYCNQMIDTAGTAAFPNALRFLYGIELIDPTADKRVVEFCLSTPSELFFDQEKSRLLVRHGLHDVLPPSIRERTSRGMQAADWYKNIEKQQHELKEKLCSWEKSKVADYIDIHHLLNELEQWNMSNVETSSGKKYHSYSLTYQHKLLRAIETGLFIQQHFGDQRILFN